MKSWIHFSKGQVPHQAHVGVGELKEDELGRQGFSGRVTLSGSFAWGQILTGSWTKSARRRPSLS